MEFFRIDTDDRLVRLERGQFDKESKVHCLLESNLQTALGVRFLASEYSTGPKHAGRIDTLGIDENGTPVILEYKLSHDASIITQALYYLDWLVDHRAEFESLVMKQFGPDMSVDWTAPRVICVAQSFNKFDRHAVAQMGREIELVEYAYSSDGYLSLDLLNGVQKSGGGEGGGAKGEYTLESLLESYASLRPLAEELLAYAEELADDVLIKPLAVYIALRTSKNFACLFGNKTNLYMTYHLDPTLAEECAEYCEDVTNKGHWGTGNLLITITGADQVEKAKELMQRAYELRAGV